MFRKNAPRKLKSRYFQRSLRYPVALIYLLIFAGVLAEKIFSNYSFGLISSLQWILIGSGFAVLFLMETVEALVYPKTPYFFLGVLLSGIRIIAIYLIAISEPTGIGSALVGYLIFTTCFYFTPLAMLPVLLIFFVRLLFAARRGFSDRGPAHRRNLRNFQFRGAIFAGSRHHLGRFDPPAQPDVDQPARRLRHQFDIPGQASGTRSHFA